MLTKHKPIVLKKTKYTTVVLSIDTELVTKYNCCDETTAKAFIVLLRYLKQIDDNRLVKILNFGITDDGYYYSMEYCPKKLTFGQSGLVNSFLYYKDQCEKLSNKFPELYNFLKNTEKLYFDIVDHNLRKDKFGNFRWIDLEGLEWSWTSDGNVFLSNNFIGSFL